MKNCTKNSFLLIPDDKRSRFDAGRFKIEWSGTQAVAVGAKCYCVANIDDKVVKLAARGVPYVAAKSIGFKQFHEVLSKHKTITVECQSFNYVQGRMLREKLMKRGISPYYLKREMLPDYSTRTLKL